jgi:hypothetical protein
MSTEWFYRLLANGQAYIIWESYEFPICAVNHEEHARMLCAAPDMLAVLQELDKCASYWSEYDVPIGIHDRMKAAIAKAKGGQQ